MNEHLGDLHDMEVSESRDFDKPTLVAPNVQPPNVQHCPQCVILFEQFVFCPVSPLCNT